MSTTSDYNAETGVTTVTEWNLTTDTYTVTVDGEVTEQRPLTDAERADLTAAETYQTEQTNHATLVAEIEQNIDVLLATVESLNEITSRTNATINANPAVAIKDVAREVKTVARQTIRIARVLTGTTDTIDSGS